MLFGVVLVTFAAQQMLNPILAPLSREVRLPDLAVGAILTVSAALFTVTSLLWGRAVDRVGHRRVLLAGLALTTLGLLGFAVVGQSAITGDVPPAVTFAVMVAARSVIFGVGMGAVAVAATALVAASTDAANRTRGMGQLGAAQGLSVAVGPAIGAGLAFAGLLGPLWAAPVLAAAAFVAVAVLVPRSPERAPTDTGPSGGDSGPARRLRPWDSRLWPVLVAGFGAYLTLGMLIVVVGFLVQDRLGLDADATAQVTGLLLVTAGVVLIFTQGVLVPRLRWAPARLLRTGLPIAALATVAFLPAEQVWMLAVAMALLAVGLGLAVPGYTAAPTLLVGPQEQGSVAGLIQATTGATFVLAPILGAGLYQLSPTWPFIVGAATCVVVSAFAWLHPALRPSRGPTGAVPTTPTPTSTPGTDPA